MVYNTKLSKFFQVGMVAGGVASCGDKDIPGYYTRLDYPEIADFIQAPESYSRTGNTSISVSPLYKGVLTLLLTIQHVFHELRLNLGTKSKLINVRSILITFEVIFM
jgi:hypothetical protein